MDYPANILDATKRSDEKLSSEIEQAKITTRTTSKGSNVARFISEKLLYWGVEERGAYLSSALRSGLK